MGAYDLYGGTPPFERDSNTSLAAAKSQLTNARTTREEVRSFIGMRGKYGATDDEVEYSLGMLHQTASARRRELVLLGELRATGTRPTRTGRQARVHVVTGEGV